jgi:integrase
VKSRAGESKRDFDDAEAAIILAAAQRQADPVKRWIPLLGAYSGARVSEICQLRVEDITQLSGICA